MSPGNHIRALTATKAKANVAIIRAGKSVDLKKPKIAKIFSYSDTNRPLLSAK